MSKIQFDNRRAVDEWRGATPDAAIPARVKLRKPDGMPWSIELIRHWSDEDPVTGCWLWRKAVAKHGYGVIRFEKRMIRAHRLAYELAAGVSVPRHIDVCHRCDVRRCVNPGHLFEGTRADNMADCKAKGRIKLPPVLSGEDSPNSKLSADQARAIRASGKPHRALAREYGVTRVTIKQLIIGRTWRNL